MLTNEVQIVSTDIVPSDVCVQAVTNQVDLDVDTSYTVTGFKREYAIVGDAYFATVTAGDTPPWLLDLINNIIDNSLTSVLIDVNVLKNSVLESLRELDVAKNQYEELINIEATIDSIISSRLATLNANLANANAQIIELNTTKVTPQQAAAISINQISSELNLPSGVLYGAITDIRTTVTNLNGELDAKYAELYGITDGMGYSLSVEIERVEASIETVAETVTEAIIESKNLALATDVLAVAEQVTTLTATVDADRSYVNSGFSAITSELSSQASATTTLRADMDTEFAAVESDMTAFATSLGTIGARYGVKLTAGGVNPAGSATSLVGGFELLNDGSLVSAGFDVDEFWVGRTAVTGKKPFRIVSGVVYIDTAVIQNASIDFAKISDTLQSTNYVPNVSGWAAFKSGYAEFENVKARGDIQASSLQVGTAMVDTLNVNGSAITVAYYAYTAPGYTLTAGSSSTGHAPISVTMPSGSTGAMFIASLAIGSIGVSTNSQVDISILKDGSVIGGNSYSVSNADTYSHVVTAFDPTPTGTHTYTITVAVASGGDSVKFWNASLMCIGAKR